MALETLCCPHCLVKSLMETQAHATAWRDNDYFLFVCPKCRAPVVVHAELTQKLYDFREGREVDSAEQTFAKCGWRMVDSWPKPHYREVEAPGGVPNDIGALFAHAQEAALRGCYDLAAMGFARVLEMTQVALSPGKQQKLHVWILSLISDGQLTANLRSWSNRVKGVRTAAAGCTAQEAEELAAFVHIVLEQIFLVRSRAAPFRKQTELL